MKKLIALIVIAALVTTESSGSLPIDRGATISKTRQFHLTPRLLKNLLSYTHAYLLLNDQNRNHKTHLSQRSELRVSTVDKNVPRSHKRKIERIPFYRFLSDWNSLKASVVIMIGALFFVFASSIGGFIMLDQLKSGFYAASLYTGLIMMILTASTFSIGEIVVLQCLMLFRKSDPETSPVLIRDEDLPSVTVQIPVRNEPIEIVATTIQSVMSLDYPKSKLKIQIIDNSETMLPITVAYDAENDYGPYKITNGYDQLKSYFQSPEIRDYLARHGPESIVLIHRDSRAGGKAGNLNLGIRQTTSPYIFQLDSDSAVKQEALRLMISDFIHHEKNRRPGEPRLAYIQSALETNNKDESLLAKVVGVLEEIFEEMIEPIRKHYRFNSSGGHHIVMRREAIDDVGGHPEDIGVGEDGDLAIEINSRADINGERKWFGKRVDYIRMAESVPETWKAFKTQRWRWVFGSSRVFIKQFSNIWSSPMKWNEKYTALFDLSMFYQSLLIIISTFLTPIVLLPAIVTGKAEFPQELSAVIMVSWFSGYGLTFLMALKYLAREREKSAVHAVTMFLAGASLFFALIPTIASGTIQALYRKNTQFKVTAKASEKPTSFLSILADNRFEVLLGIYYLAFIPFIPVAFGYTIPALMIGLSLILWPLHLKIHAIYQVSVKAMKTVVTKVKFSISNESEKNVKPKMLWVYGGIITLTAVFLRFYNLKYLGPWMDESNYIDAGRDIFSPDRNWGWINGWKYAFPPLAAFGTWLFSSFVGARVMTAVFGTLTLMLTYLSARWTIFNFFKSDHKTTNEKRSLWTLAALATASPLIYVSRLAVYDSLAYFFFSLSLYSIQRATVHQKKSALYVVSAVALSAAVVSKYVTILMIPFMVSYALLVSQNSKTWLRKFIFPLSLILGGFFIINFNEFSAGVSLTGKGYWVNRNLLGVLTEAFYIIGVYIPFFLIGLWKIPREKKSWAYWLLGGSIVIILYHIYDRHIMALLKGLSLFLIISAPLIGIGIAELVSLRWVRPWTGRFIKLAASVSLFFGGYMFQAKNMTSWEDQYVPIEAVKKAASGISHPSIFTTRAHDLLLFAPELADSINQTKDFSAVPERLKPYIQTRFIVPAEEVVIKILKGEYDIVYITPEYWQGWDPSSKKFCQNIRDALYKKGYVLISYDGLPRSTSIGETKKPSDSHVFVHPKHAQSSEIQTILASLTPIEKREQQLIEAFQTVDSMQTFINKQVRQQGYKIADGANSQGWLSGITSAYINSVFSITHFEEEFNSENLAKLMRSGILIKLDDSKMAQTEVIPQKSFGTDPDLIKTEMQDENIVRLSDSDIEVLERFNRLFDRLDTYQEISEQKVADAKPATADKPALKHEQQVEYEQSLQDIKLITRFVRGHLQAQNYHVLVSGEGWLSGFATWYAEHKPSYEHLTNELNKENLERLVVANVLMHGEIPFVQNSPEQTPTDPEYLKALSDSSGAEMKRSVLAHLQSAGYAPDPAKGVNWLNGFVGWYVSNQPARSFKDELTPERLAELEAKEGVLVAIAELKEKDRAIQAYKDALYSVSDTEDFVLQYLKKRNYAINPADQEGWLLGLSRWYVRARPSHEHFEREFSAGGLAKLQKEGRIILLDTKDNRDQALVYYDSLENHLFMSTFIETYLASRGYEINLDSSVPASSSDIAISFLKNGLDGAVQASRVMTGEEWLNERAVFYAEHKPVFERFEREFAGHRLRVLDEKGYLKKKKKSTNRSELRRLMQNVVNLEAIKGIDRVLSEVNLFEFDLIAKSGPELRGMKVFSRRSFFDEESNLVVAAPRIAARHGSVMAVVSSRAELRAIQKINETIPSASQIIPVKSFQEAKKRAELRHLPLIAVGIDQDLTYFQSLEEQGILNRFVILSKGTIEALLRGLESIAAQFQAFLKLAYAA